MKKHDVRTCPDCRAVLDDLKQWLAENAPLVEELEAMGMTASEARLHLHLSEMAANPRVLLVQSSAVSGGGVWN